MNIQKLIILISIFFYLIPNDKLSEFDVLNKIANLNWKKPGTYKLPISNSTLIVPEGRMILIGNKDASRYAFLINHCMPNKNLEAVTVDKNFENAVILLRIMMAIFL